MQDDWNRKVFLIAQVAFQKGLDGLLGVAQRSNFGSGLSLIQLNELDHTIGCPCVLVKDQIEIGMVLFQNL